MLHVVSSSPLGQERQRKGGTDRAVFTRAAGSASARSRRSASTARHDDLGVGGVLVERF